MTPMTPMTPWLEDRRWRWRVITFILMLIVIAVLVWHGYDPLAAIFLAMVIFSAGGFAVDKVINSLDTPSPSAPASWFQAPPTASGSTPSVPSTPVYWFPTAAAPQPIDPAPLMSEDGQQQVGPETPDGGLEAAA
jgi:hypothetical protein